MDLFAYLLVVFSKTLPCLIYVKNQILYIQGHNFLPMVFTVDADSKLSFVAKLDAAVRKEAETMSAMAKFRSMDKQALGAASSKSVTTHQNAIKYVQLLHYNILPFDLHAVCDQKSV